MATTHTTTSARTFLRLSLLKIQVRIALIRAAGIAQITLNEIIDKAMDEKALERVKIYGMDESNICQAGLLMAIDWERYELQIKGGHETVKIDERWRNDVAPEIDEAVKMFARFVKERNLKVEVHYNISGDFTKYGLVIADEVRLAEALRLTVEELPELSVTVLLPKS